MRFSLLMMSLTLSGCISGGYSVAVGPTLDTNGTAGCLLQAQMSVGYAGSRHSGFRIGPSAAIGADFKPGRFRVEAGPQVNWIHYWRKVGLRLGFGDGYAGSSDPEEWRNDLYLTFPAALLFVLDRHRSSSGGKFSYSSHATYKSLGIQFEPKWYVSMNDRPNRAGFFLGPVFEFDVFSRW